MQHRVIRQVLADGLASPGDRVLVLCGGPRDRDLLVEARFTDVTISNIDDAMAAWVAPCRWDGQDAEHLTYADGAFDVAMVSAGLHHCHSPHRALLEMYRVARRTVIVFEARDSLTMRLATRLGFGVDYELEAVSDEGYRSGGVANGPIPNFVYRWTEREVRKTIASYDPAHPPQVRFHYGLRLPYQRFENTRRPLLRTLLSAFGPLVELAARLFPTQGNEFAFVIAKHSRLHPWLRLGEDGPRVDEERVRRLGRVYRRKGDRRPG